MEYHKRLLAQEASGGHAARIFLAAVTLVSRCLIHKLVRGFCVCNLSEIRKDMA
jgi:hypothetical protein